MDDFVIDQVSWHLDTEGNPETPEMIYARFISLISFLQTNDLCVRQLVTGEEVELDRDFALRSSDLTETGLELIKKALDKWVRKVDRGMSPDDTTLLEKNLRQILSDREKS